MEIHQVVASRTKRFWAFAIDQTILSLIGVVIFLGVFATQVDQLTNFINVVFSDPLWSQLNSLPEAEANRRVNALFRSDAVISSVQALAHPFALAISLTLLFDAIYYIVPTTKWGGTPGKLWLRIRVHQLQTSSLPNWEQSAIRYFTFLGLSTFSGLVGILDLLVNKAFLPSNIAVDILENFLSQVIFVATVIITMMIMVRPDRRGLHDIFARTIVHDTPKSAVKRQP